MPTNAANGTYYIGVVVPWTPEADNNPGNNVRTQAFALSGGTTCSNDSHEADNSAAAAQMLALGSSRMHNHCDGTADWVKFDAVAGKTYGIATSELGAEAWTLFTLYGTDGQTVLAYGTGTLWDINAAYLKWTAPANGTYYLRVSPMFGLDSAGANSSYRLALGDLLPDLVVSSFQAPATGLPGGNINLSDTVLNHGFAAAGSFDVSVYLSSSPNVTTGDVLLGTRSVNGLAVGAWDSSPTPTYGLPANLSPGIYYLGSIVNGTRAVNEFTTDNNTRVSPITIQVPAGCSADAYEQDDTYTAATAIAVGAAAQAHNHCEDTLDWLSFAATAGERYAVRVTRVGGYAQTWVELYGSDGNTRLAGNAASGTVAIDWQALAGGTYYLKLGGTLGVATDYTVKVERQLPDLTSALSTQTTTVTAGGFLSVYDTVTNIGFAASGPFQVGFYRSPSSSVTTANPQIGARSLTTLGTQSSGNYTDSSWSNVHFAKDTPPGTYYVAAIADGSGAVTELNEANNTSAAIAVSVVAPPCAIDGYEDDDSAGAAKPIAPGETQSRNLCDDTVDWARFTPAATGTYVAHSSTTSTRLAPYQTDGATRVPVRDSYFESRVSFTANAGITYLLRAEGFSGNSYQLAIFQCTQLTYDTAAAPAISVGETQARNHCDRSHDWSRFSATAGTTYTITASGSDLWLTLFDTNGTSNLAFGQSIQGGKKRQITWTAPASGTYYIDTQLNTAFGQNTDYTLSLD